MKINFDQEIIGRDKEPIKTENGDKATLEFICSQALLGHYVEENIKSEEKMNRFKLQHRINNGGEVDLKSSDIERIKHVVGMMYPPLIMGNVFLMLEKKKLDSNGEEIEANG